MTAYLMTPKARGFGRAIGDRNRIMTARIDNSGINFIDLSDGRDEDVLREWLTGRNW